MSWSNPYHIISFVILCLLLLPGGTLICNSVFKLFNIASTIDNADANTLSTSGKLIGYLERVIIACGIFLNHWELLAIVVGLKTVARYKLLDNKLNAEYFLIGSLLSVFWALLCVFIYQKIISLL